MILRRALLTPLPDLVAIGREAFPVDPIGRTWTYRRPDGTRVERTISGACPGLPLRGGMIVISQDPLWIRDHGWQLDRTDWSYDTGPVRPAIERIDGEWLRFPLTDDAHWSSGFVDLDRHGRDPWWKGLVLRHPVLGTATVAVAAGTFHAAVAVETRSEADDDRWARRTLYVANVGPELVLVPEGADRRVVDLVLESIIVPPPVTATAPRGTATPPSPTPAWASTRAGQPAP